MLKLFNAIVASVSSSTSSTMASVQLPEWPPAMMDEQRNELAKLATTYALAHGLLYLPPLPPDHQHQPRIPLSAIHAPVSLFPSPFPRVLFERALRLQRLYNALYARIALDTDFLDRVLGAEVGLGKVDEYTGNLWKCWKTVRNVGFEQVNIIALGFCNQLLKTLVAIPSRDIPFRLSVTFSVLRWPNNSEAGRIQYNFLFIWYAF